MTHEDRIAAARAYHERAAIEKAELTGLRERMGSIRQAVNGISGVPTLSKLTAFLSAVKKALDFS
jgi:hypothetical protein